ncbi:MAG: single-stranded DNA-binding protein [Bacillota bacterium]|nr:single-stranded DNA-binding protein [Bacillota bacterium]
MLNRIVLIGRLVKDPELRYTPSGVPVAQFGLAVDRSFANAQGQRETDFFDIVVWRKQGELVANYLQKGRLVAIEGRLQTRTYETQEGQRRKVYEIVADRVAFLDRKPSSQDSMGDEVEMGPDEVPFTSPSDWED